MSGDQEHVLIVRKVRAVTVFKLLLFGLLITFIPLGIVFGIAALFGADTVKWDGHPIHGIAALIASPAISIFMAVVFTGFIGALASLGLWALSLVRPIRIRFVSQDAARGDAGAG